MSKSVKQQLIHASELAALFRITTSEISHVSVYGSSMFSATISISLQLEALARVFRELRMPRSKLDISTDGEGNLHITFPAKGATWRSFVKHTEIAKWQALTGQTPDRITGPPTSPHLRQPATTKALALPAPPAPLRRLSAPAAPPPPTTAVADQPATLPGQRTLFEFTEETT